VAQPLSIVPQLSPAGHEVSGVQTRAQVPVVVLQLWPLGQAPPMGPHWTWPPQPSGCGPQARVPQTCAAVFGVHAHRPATPPPPQVWGS
jgi:hypothetical protein